MGWSVIIDCWTGQWTYGIYDTKQQAEEAAERCPPDWGTVKIQGKDTP